MPIMARQPNGEYVEICVIPSWIGGTQNDISEIKLSTDERIFKNWRTYEGTLPVTLTHTSAGNLISYKIWGNTVQNGTPTPENPIMSIGCGEKTGNLFDKNATDTNDGYVVDGYLTSNGTITANNGYRASEYIPILSNQEYITYAAGLNAPSVCFYDANKNYISGVPYAGRQYATFTTPSDAKYLRLSFRNADETIMFLNLGNTPLPYEPYGYKLPIVSSSETTDIYIGRTALEKDEYLDSESGKVYKFKEVHKDTVTINGIVWDILGYDHDEVYKEDGTRARHTVTIQTHDCVDSLQFDAREALFAFPDGLAAGSYTFTIKAHPGFPSDVDKSITFTLTQAIPEGGQLVVRQSYNASFTTGDIWSYASPFAANPIETAKMTEGDTGVSLGDVTNAIVGNANAIQRAFLGSNRWGTSAIRQYLNSDKTAGAVWEPQTIFDRPPSWGATTAGFLYGMDTDFISVLGKTKKRTALNTISDGGGYEDSIEKVFLLSRTEVYAGKENNIDEGGPYNYFKEFSDFSAPSTGKDTNRIKYRNGSASYWWLRSPYSSLTHNVEIIFPSGALGSYNAVGSNGVAPACCIILDDISQNTWLQDHFLIPTDPPVPLPQIPTSAGSTTISYGGETPLERKEVHKDTVTINGIVWDILGYDHDEVYKADGTRASHTVTIQTHDCVDSLQIDAREALFAFPDGLEAGTYYFTIKAHTWVSSDIDKSITFTLTQAIPSGGQLVVRQAYNASFTKGNISSYASSSAANPIETVAMNEGSTGTSLGDVTNSVADNTNSCQRALLGSNRWSTSAIRQYLNSDKEAGQVWTPQTKFDRPPSWASNTAGFLYGMDTDFISVLGKTKKRTALNTISDGGGYEDSIEKVFLLSQTEVYTGLNNSVNEGDPYRYFSEFSDLPAAGGKADKNRIKYGNGTAKYWWLRSPNTSNAYYVRNINPSGALNYNYYYDATSSIGVAPACCIILDDIDSNPWLQDHFLKPADPPEPLLEKVEFTYKLGV